MRCSVLGVGGRSSVALAKELCYLFQAYVRFVKSASSFSKLVSMLV
jgi:hypothetical protein